ncbi:N(4)-(beta-N-acetylglucosaminyl)-L-asparaginase [Sphaerobacter thermophilus]|uniref:Peptidase T2 asparaginase 2 n=1 Tax=Sphaerobacter thermophilus (strain ATCC 49802 / DSM 20745 / KCCM 41009 / NCIMB 13125 / S 6022) TaxID=479434 RepID=D1CAV2_SPHTD|nr:N(4)-(beta-N-acetylglucosaminyl)-L-asparaginase [Sphaerobacter thermophilus]ACZ39899.1 peptidase T2 asparaginase 2 [Sphaerobacter thermophilus DSM 20745]
MGSGAQVGVIVGSYNSRVGFPAAMEILRAGGSALDAAVAAVKVIEDNLEDHSVGTGGIPNILGQVELDASIMDGTTLAAGAVGAVKNYPHPIEIARKVMEVTPHVMLVGEGAELFARVHGFQTANLLTEEAEQEWRRHILGEDGGPVEGETYEDQFSLYMSVVKDWTKLLHKEIFGTTNVIVRDTQGNIASAVSTSGWGFKWPGRLGDSPIIGAGNYADSRFGAAACTGRGEMAIRAASAHSVVTYLRQGMTLEDALRTAMLDLRALVDPYAERDNVMNIVAMDRHGNVAAASTSLAARYVFQTTEMDDYEERPRIHVPLREE